MNFNWNNLTKVLSILGYKQSPTSARGYLYFQHNDMTKVILEKQNKYSDDQIKKYLGIMRLPRVYLEPIFKSCKE